MIKSLCNIMIVIGCAFVLVGCNKSTGTKIEANRKMFINHKMLAENFYFTSPENYVSEKKQEVVRIQGHALLEKQEFTLTTLKDMEETEKGPLSIVYSRKRSGGHLRFDIGKGIIYVTGEPDRQSEPQERRLMGVILVSDQYSITGGIEVGMESSELKRTNFVWEKRELGFTPIFIKAVQDCNLFDFDEVWYTEVGVENTDPFLEACVETYIKDGVVRAVALRWDTNNFYQFSVRDIFIEGHNSLENQCFWQVDLEEIEDEAIGVSSSEERLNGAFQFYTGKGIIYVTNTYGGDSPIGLILTNDKFSLNSGLKVGMTTEEMEATEIPFQRYEDSKISLGNIIRTEKGPIADLNYDDIYFYLGGISQKEVNEFEVMMPPCLGITVFIKNNKVIAICLDFPTAD